MRYRPTPYARRVLLAQGRLSEDDVREIRETPGDLDVHITVGRYGTDRAYVCDLYEVTTFAAIAARATGPTPIEAFRAAVAQYREVVA